MKVKILSVKDLANEIIKEMGLDPIHHAVTSIEVLSALIRRAAGLICPCTRKKLLKNVLQSLEGIISNHLDLKDKIDEIIDVLIAHGDILEHNDIAITLKRNELILNRAPLSFVKRDSGACIILGVTPDDRAVLPDFLREKIQYNNFTRVITTEAATDVSKHLSDIGFIELPYKVWSKYPTLVAPEKLIELMRNNLMLPLANSSEIIEGLRIIDPSTAVDYYRDRWIVPNEQTGLFIGRRPQAYGFDLWCYVKLENGKPLRFLDFPLPGSPWRGCDEAWHLQAAIDSSKGRPQYYKIREDTNDFKILDLFSPIPSWAQRRWAMMGMPVPKQKCLMSFRFRSTEIEEEIRFAKEHLWLSEKI